MGSTPNFDALYRADADPWNSSHSWYERRKLAVVEAALRCEKYSVAYDPACGNGDVTSVLARRATRTVACDASVTAVELATRRLADSPGVRVEQRVFPSVPFGVRPGEDAVFPDLVALIEFLYYLDEKTLAMVPDAVHELGLARGDAGIEVVLAHWRYHLPQAPHSGELVHRWMATQLVRYGWGHVVHHDDEEFLVDVLTLGACTWTPLD